MAGRGRPKGSKKNAAPNPDAIPGHNKGPAELTPEQRRALMFMAKRDLKAADEAVRIATNARKLVMKRIKSEVDGGVKKVRRMIFAETPAGEAAIRADMEMDREVFEWNGIAVGEQVDMFPVDRRPAEDKAYEEGKIAGLEGKDCKPPYDASVPQFNGWQDGWADGQAVNRSLLAGMRKPDENVEDEMPGDEPPDAEDDE